MQSKNSNHQFKRKFLITLSICSISFLGLAQDGSFNNLTTNSFTKGNGFQDHSGWGMNTANLVDQRPNAQDKPVFVMNNHYGLTFSAHSYYGGIRFYNQAYPAAPLDGAQLVMSLVNGNAGIGTPSPIVKLHVAGGQIIETSGTTPNTRTLTLMNSSTNQVYFGAYNGSWRSSIQIQNNNATKGLFLAPPETDYNYSIIRSVNGGIKLDVGGSYSDVGTNALTIESNSNVGIGTSAPRGIFDVATNGDVYLASSPNTGTTQSTFLSGHVYLAPYSGGDISYLQARRQNNTGTTSLRIRTYNNGSLVEAMHIAGDGKVGIGTTNPQALLSVNGDIYSRKVKVTQTGWADYVFHSNYKLPLLKEVEEYIKQHHHLPDVPSANEVEKNGLDVGDNQAVLLKKIEELTLYIIDQDKQIKILKEQTEKIAQLQQQFDELKKMISR